MFSNFLPKTFRPSNAGMQKVFGELESQIMEYIWEHQQSTVREVCDAMKGEKNLSFNTVMTVMNRLVEKNILCKQKQGKSFVYSAVISEKEFSGSVASSVLTALFAENSFLSAAHFADVRDKLDDQTLQKLKDFIAVSE